MSETPGPRTRRPRRRMAVAAAALVAAGLAAAAPADAHRASPFGGAYAHERGTYLTLPYVLATPAAPEAYKTAIDVGMKAWFDTPTLLWPFAGSLDTSKADFYVDSWEYDWWGLTLNQGRKQGATSDGLCSETGCTYSYGNIYLNQRTLDPETAFQRQKVVVHEMGHALGLSHVVAADRTPSIMMQGRLLFNVPQAHDVNDVNDMYPAEAGGSEPAAEGTGETARGGLRVARGAALYPTYGTVRALAARSHLVVRARVDARAATRVVIPDGVSARLPKRKQRELGYVETDVTVSVSGVVKGAGAVAVGDALTVAQPGGRSGRDVTVVEGEPVSPAGAEQVLFLRRTRSGRYVVVGGNQGRYAIRAGRLRPVSGEAAGLPVPKRLSGMSAAAFTGSFARLLRQRVAPPPPKGRQEPLEPVPERADKPDAPGRGPIPRPPGR